MSRNNTKERYFDYRYRGSLLNETGNIEIYRVSEETRKRVAEESKRIQEKIKLKNSNSRKEINQEEATKIRIKEVALEKMLHRWEKKTARNPLGADQYDLELKRLARLEQQSKRRKELNNQLKSIGSLEGKSNLSLIDKNSTANFKPDAVLALEFLKSLREEEVVKHEKELLERMLKEEMNFLRNSFPSSPFPTDQEKMDEFSNQSSDDQAISDRHQKPEDFDAANPEVYPRLRSGNALYSSRTPEDVGDNYFTGENNSGEYSPPVERMQKLIDNLNLDL